MADEVVFGEEPGSPATKLFHSKKLNCCILAIIGFKVKVDVEVFKARIPDFLPNVPRFSSLMVKDEKHDKMTWVPTTINIDDHIFCPDLEYEDQENPSLGDEVVDEYMTRLTSKPMDLNKPLWEMHILNTKTSSANATALFLIHHSIGDGVSLISVLLAMTRKTSDPESLPTIPTRILSDKTSNEDGNTISGTIKGVFSKLWEVLLVLMFTCYDVALFLATMIFLKDTESLIKGGPGIEGTQKRVMHMDVSLDDIKLVKTATNATINDVIMGLTQAGLSRYLNRRYASNHDQGAKNKLSNLPKKIRIRALLVFNIRPSAGIQVLANMMKTKSNAKWGNLFGYSLMPITIALKNDTLSYILQAQAIIKRKKLSLESRFAYVVLKFGNKLLGAKATSWLTHRVMDNVTIAFSNVVGPREEVSFFEHPITFIAPSAHGLPFALLIHYQSYMNKMTIVFTYDALVIPDPKQLFVDIENSLQDIKNDVVSRGH